MLASFPGHGFIRLHFTFVNMLHTWYMFGQEVHRKTLLPHMYTHTHTHIQPLASKNSIQLMVTHCEQEMVEHDPQSREGDGHGKGEE